MIGKVYWTQEGVDYIEQLRRGVQRSIGKDEETVAASSAGKAGPQKGERLSVEEGNRWWRVQAQWLERGYIAGGDVVEWYRDVEDARSDKRPDRVWYRITYDAVREWFADDGLVNKLRRGIEFDVGFSKKHQSNVDTAWKKDDFLTIEAVDEASAASREVASPMRRALQLSSATLGLDQRATRQAMIRATETLQKVRAEVTRTQGTPAQRFALAAVDEAQRQVTQATKCSLGAGTTATDVSVSNRRHEWKKAVEATTEVWKAASLLPVKPAAVRQLQKLASLAVEAVEDAYARVYVLIDSSCWSGDSTVTLSDGRRKLVRDVRRGDKLKSGHTTRGRASVFEVDCVVETRVPVGSPQLQLVQYSRGMAITAGHPIFIDGQVQLT